MHLARASAGEELLGQRVRDVPLARRGVLHLIQQQVIQAAVELVQHPGRARFTQQLVAAVDQVVVIELTGVLLARGIFRQHRRGEAHKRRRHGGHGERPAVILNAGNTLSFRDIGFQQRRLPIAQRLVDIGRGPADFAGGAQEDIAPFSPVFGSHIGVQPQPAQHPRRPFLHGGGPTGLHRLRRLAQRVLRGPGHGAPANLRRAASRHPQHAPLCHRQIAAQRQRRPQPLPVAAKLPDQSAALACASMCSRASDSASSASRSSTS